MGKKKNRKEKNDKETLLALYDLIQRKEEFYHQRADDDPLNIINFIIIVVGALIGLRVFNEGSFESGEIYMLYFLAPIFTAFGITRQCFYARFVAILRGYAKYIEECINHDLGKELYLWDQKMFDTFMTPSKFPTYSASLVIFVIGFILPDLYALYMQIKYLAPMGKLHIALIAGIWGLCGIITLISLWDCLHVEKVRKKAYEYAKNHEISIDDIP